MTKRLPSLKIGIAILAVVSLIGGCSRSQGGSTAPAPSNGIPSQGTFAAVPLGQVAGAPSLSVEELSTANPYANNPQAVEQGRALYVKMNCAGCHAYNGKGNMGPSLTDTYWRYGGLPIQVYKSIRDGRPEGMPAWGIALPPDAIWKLVAYIQSLGGTVSPKNYKGARQGDQPGDQVAPEAQADADAGSAVATEAPTDSLPQPTQPPSSAASSDVVPTADAPTPKSKPPAAPPKKSGPQP